MAIRGSAFTVRERLGRHGDALAILVIGACLLSSGYLVASRELSRTTATIIESKPSPHPAATVAQASSSTINLNSATLEELDSLPRVGPVLARKILDYRAAHGGFRSVDDLDQVSGIGPATLEKLRPLISAP